MKQSFLYGILFAIPGIVISLLVTYLSTGMIFGFLWLFVFGDNSWPDWVAFIIPIVSICIFLITLAVITTWGHQTGIKLEEKPKYNLKHIFYSIIATVIPVLIFAFLLTEPARKNTPSLICSDYCQTKGYSTSSTPPKNTGLTTCNCLDDNGANEITIELDDIPENN